MKKIVSLFLVVVVFMSCQQDIQTNSPSFQAKKNNDYWKANDVTVELDANGAMTIRAFTQFETIVLKTENSIPGSYILGTTNQNNFASYSYNLNGNSFFYDTGLYSGPAFKLSNIIQSGTAYQPNPSGAITSGGTGVGLKVATLTTSGSVTSVRVVARGIGYTPGDVITILGGDNNATFSILNVQQSNGEIEIEEVEGGLFTGKYKFNAVNENGDVITFSEGVFYKIPISTF